MKVNKTYVKADTFLLIILFEYLLKLPTDIEHELNMGGGYFVGFPALHEVVGSLFEYFNGYDFAKISGYKLNQKYRKFPGYKASPVPKIGVRPTDSQMFDYCMWVDNNKYYQPTLWGYLSVVFTISKNQKHKMRTWMNEYLESFKNSSLVVSESFYSYAQHAKKLDAFLKQSHKLYGHKHFEFGETDVVGDSTKYSLVELLLIYVAERKISSLKFQPPFNSCYVIVQLPIGFSSAKELPNLFMDKANIWKKNDEKNKCSFRGQSLKFIRLLLLNGDSSQLSAKKIAITLGIKELYDVSKMKKRINEKFTETLDLPFNLIEHNEIKGYYLNSRYKITNNTF